MYRYSIWSILPSVLTLGLNASFFLQFVRDHSSPVLVVVMVGRVHNYYMLLPDLYATALIASTPDGIMEKSMAASVADIVDIKPEEKTSDKIKAICKNCNKVDRCVQSVCI
jgi:hypothetical protein